MADYSHIKAKAITLRHQGMALGEIVDRLKVPKSTVFSWVKDISIPKTDKQSLAQKKGSQANKEKCAKDRSLHYDIAYQEAPIVLSHQPFRDFIVLYMAEGYRRNRNVVAISNSNYKIMLLSYKFITELSKNKIDCFVQYHSDQDIEALQLFWSELLSVLPSDIKAISKSNSGKLSGRNWRSEFGVLTIRVGDTRLRAKIEAWMDYIFAEWVNGV